MCLTVPRKIEEVKGDKAKLQDGRWVKTGMIGKVKCGDMVLVQADLAIEKVSKDQVKEMKELMEPEI